MPEYRDETGRVRSRDMEYAYLATPEMVGFPPGGIPRPSPGTPPPGGQPPGYGGTPGGGPRPPGGPPPGGLGNPPGGAPGGQGAPPGGQGAPPGGLGGNLFGGLGIAGWLRSHAGSGGLTDRITEKLGYIPGSVATQAAQKVETAKSDLATTASRFTGAQATLAGAQTTLGSAVQAVQGAASGVTSAVTSAQSIAHLDAVRHFAANPQDLKTALDDLKSEVQAIDASVTGILGQVGTLGSAISGLGSSISGLSGVGQLKGLLDTIRTNLLAYKSQIGVLNGRLAGANAWLTNLLSTTQNLTGNTYVPTSFDSMPIGQLPGDLGNLANSLGPNGIGGYVSSLTGLTYGAKDLLSGKILGDLKNAASDFQNAIQGSLRMFAGGVQLLKVDPTSSVSPSAASQAAQQPDQYGIMQDGSDQSELPSSAPGGPFDGWDGDTLNAGGTMNNPVTQFDAGPAFGLGLGIGSQLRASLRSRLTGKPQFDTLPSGINVADFPVGWETSFDGGKSWSGLQWNGGGTVPMVMGPGQVTPQLHVQCMDKNPLTSSPLTKVVSKFQASKVWNAIHKLRTHSFGFFPTKVVDALQSATDINNKTFTWTGYVQLLDRSGGPVANAAVRFTALATDGVHAPHHYSAKATTDSSGKAGVNISGSYPDGGGTLKLRTFYVPLRNPALAFSGDGHI